MFIHLGADVVINSEEVIAIFNYEIFLKEELNKSFIKDSAGSMKLLGIGGETKSVVLTKQCIYYSPFSPTTLNKRSQKTLQ